MVAALADDARRLQVPLQTYVHALWDASPSLAFGDELPFLSGDTLHLPLAHAAVRVSDWHWYRGAAAHAAAHRAFSPAGFDGRGLAPIVRALVGMLEDARVETLACRELGGLRRLWTPLHVARPEDGDGCETLMLRLARALIDPQYGDPSPWIAKGRALFFADSNQGMLAPPPPGDLRRIASLLGNDLGQMRIRFNAAGYRPGPDYRDDLRWMWPPAEALVPAQRQASDAPSPGQSPPASTRVLHPEWDHLIARLRHDWCVVVEQDMAAATATPVLPLDEGLLAALVRALRHATRTPATRAGRDGEHVDLDALVRWRVARRAHATVDPRVFRQRVAQGRVARGRVVLVIDRSASSASPWERQAMSLLEGATRAASLLARGFAKLGIDAAICGFSSHGRLDVRVDRIKGFDDTMDAGTRGRMAALTSERSTRLGAAIRHASRWLEATAGPRTIVVLSDGETHDVDIHDPRYLVEDARHAVRHASHAGVRTFCLVLDAQGMTGATRIFGKGRCATLDALAGLPRTMDRIDWR